MRFETILFDLDGTLTESAPGITKSIQYALKEVLNIEASLQDLECFVGPPLNEAFPAHYGTDEATTIELIRKFRERFETIGIYENALYPGIAQMLSALYSADIRLAVASSKPEHFVHRILEYFDVYRYFSSAIGSSPDGELSEKGEKNTARSEKDLIVESSLLSMGIRKEDYSRVAMVGDRHYDIQGAHANGIYAVGVSYGYGSAQELKEAGADFIAPSVQELQAFLLS